MEAWNAANSLKFDENMSSHVPSGIEMRDSCGSMETADHLQALLRQEAEAYPPCVDYLRMVRQLSDVVSKETISESWRRKLCEWSYEVVDHFGFDREAVSIALNFLDRYVAFKVQENNHAIRQREFQLLAVTCLYMALKIHGETEDQDGLRRKLPINAFEALSRRCFRVNMIEDMERDIFKILDWRVNPPTCVRFVSSFLRLCPKWQLGESTNSHNNVIGTIFDVARYLTELSVCISAFSCTYKTSVFAYASILCGIDVAESKTPLPYAVRVVFEQNVAHVAGLTPNCEDVIHAKTMIKDLCPDMFNRIETIMEIPPSHLEDFSDLSEQVDGKVSPVCVMDEVNDMRRKRNRSSPNN